MKQQGLHIDMEILKKYPDAAIGYMLVDNLDQVSAAKIPEAIRKISLQAISHYGLTLQNLTEFPAIATWRSIYQDCKVKPKTYKSSVESLIRRFLQNDYREILPIVDLYNYASAGFILPVGGYNFQNIAGTLTLRFGSENDKFISLNGKSDIDIMDSQIVYADENVEEPIICWMWNHKDCKRTMLTGDVTNGLFLFDCNKAEERGKLIEAQRWFGDTIVSFGGSIVTSGIIDIANPGVIF